jgi:hypothetical protein
MVSLLNISNSEGIAVEISAADSIFLNIVSDCVGSGMPTIALVIEAVTVCEQTRLFTWPDKIIEYFRERFDALHVMEKGP